MPPAPSDPAAAPDVLVQVHVPKCAGTSVALWMWQAKVTEGEATFGSLYEMGSVLEEDALWNAGLRDPHLRALSSHEVRRYPAAIRGRRLHYFTILRHPLANFLSAVRYSASDRAKFGVPDAVGNSTREISEWLLSRPLGEPFRENHQTNHLALYEWCATAATQCDPERYGAWDPLDQAAYARDRLEVAKRVLRSFMAVGIVERLPASLELVRLRSRAFGLMLPPVESIPWVNTTGNPLEDTSWLATDPLGARLLESVAVDWDLYLYAQQLLEGALHAEERAG